VIWALGSIGGVKGTGEAGIKAAGAAIASAMHSEASYP